MAERHKVRKPRTKNPKGSFEFWCFYHKRFFSEVKKFSHCIPKGCFEFNQEDYLERMGHQNKADIQLC